MVSLCLYKTGTADEKRDEAKLATALRVAGASLATLKQAPRAPQSRCSAPPPLHAPCAY